jgi:hypothetical protein
METLPALPGNSVSVGAELQQGTTKEHERTRSSRPHRIFRTTNTFLFFIFTQKTRARTLDDDNGTNTLSGNKKNILFPRDRKRSTGNKILILLPVAHLCNGSNVANGTATEAPPNQISMARAPFGALLRNALSES